MAYPAAASSSTQTSQTSPCTVTAPSGMAAGDYLVFGVAMYSQVNSSITPPSGLTVLDTFSPGGSANKAMTYYAKYATAADVTAGSFAFSFSDNGTTQNTISVGVVRVTGMDTTTAINVASYGHTLATLTATTATMTPTTQCLYLLFASSIVDTAGTSYSNQRIASNNPSWTELYDTGRAGTAPVRVTGISCAWANQTAAGGIATGTATVDVTCAINTDNNVALIAIQPPITVVATSIPLTTTIGTPMFVRKMIVTALTFATTIGTPTISLTALWKNASKNLSTWVNQIKS